MNQTDVDHQKLPASDAADESQGSKYSIVIPVYNSAPILPKLVEEIDRFFDEHGYRYEIIFVNDGSADDSWNVLQEIKGDRSNITTIDLMRNYGQHSAVFCGFRYATGDFVITMDDDLQNPPQELEHLIRKADEGFDVVFGKFEQKMHGLVRKLGSHVVGWLNTKLFRKPPELTLTNFRIIRRDVAEAVCSFQTSFPYIPGLLLLSGKSFTNVTVEHHPRQQGTSNYDFKAIAKLVWRIVINYSAFPLRMMCAVGIVVALIALTMAVFYLIRAIFYGSVTPGWPTLVILLSFYQALMLLILALVGEYLVRIVHDVSGERAYRIRTKR